MSTTRHLINRQRRRQAVGHRTVPAARATDDAGPQETPGNASRTLIPLLTLCALTVLLGAFAGFAHSQASVLRNDPVRANTALTDLARTSEIKGQATKAVASLFSYDHAKPSAFESASKTLLTGKAVTQHRALFGDVLAQAEKEKTVITTAVTDSAVERIDGDRARVLVYADQSSVSTAGTGKQAQNAQNQGVYAGAMLALDLVDRDGHWLVEGIDTFGR
ncbi:hypothetical protein [Streptomyces sp. NBC_01264]|uniref:hypothetical protein n=1 Tax=Streptomyces sp. NBC_01264 TaxID=2903804 RepID=UPI0022526D9C|nr:hypothetical protein [Streptomyces sp. NBC_01264]MCX4775561.1 hypothetical protein [Streptomyces sp. NBC_01264]